MIGSEIKLGSFYIGKQKTTQKHKPHTLIRERIS